MGRDLGEVKCGATAHEVFGRDGEDESPRAERDGTCRAGFCSMEVTSPHNRRGPMNGAILRSLALLGAMSLGAGCLWAEDWPQWRGPNRDARASGFKAPKTWPKELKEKW